MQKIKLFFRIEIKLLMMITFLFFSSSVFAEVEDMNDYEYLKLEINNNINFNLDIEQDYDVKDFKVSSYFLPQTFDGTQYLNSFKTTHNKYKIINNSGILSLKFDYTTNSIEEKNSIENIFVVESTKHEPRIYSKIKYPLTTIEDEYEEYLGFENLIDVDSAIREQASKLASGEDDTYIIASKIAKWIREDIKYDLKTVTENPNQKSSEVFQSKTGVCKEISNLYISMMRSLGVPSRIITGYAYTNSEELINFVGSPWGGHAWVEVLIGDEWVPFDLTYNQYGYVDATHIILDKSAHIRTNSLYINSTGYGYKFAGQTSSQIDFEVLNKAEKIKSDEIGYDIEISGPDKIGFESYGYLKLDIENKDDYYKILFISLSKITEVENLDLTQRMIIFKPNEEKEVYFRYKITNELKSNYQYTFPFTVYNDFFEQKHHVVVKEDYLKIKQIALPEEEIEENQLSENDLIFDCNYILSNPKNTILCSVKNPNNYEINNLQICLEENCDKIDLKLNEQKSFSFSTSNIEEKLTYSYENKERVLNLQIDMPNLIYEIRKIDNGIFLNYEIENHIDGVLLGINLNNESYDITGVATQNIFIPLDKENNVFKIELMYDKEVISTESFDANINITNTVPRYLENESLWSKLVKFFKSLFA